MWKFVNLTDKGAFIFGHRPKTKKVRQLVLDFSVSVNIDTRIGVCTDTLYSAHRGLWWDVRIPLFVMFCDRVTIVGSIGLTVLRSTFNEFINKLCLI